MNVAALTFLSVIAEKKCYIMLVRHGPETISLVDREGEPLPVTVAGFNYCPLSMSRKVFNSLLHANLIEQDLPEDMLGRTFFRLAVAGQQCAEQVHQSAPGSQIIEDKGAEKIKATKAKVLLPQALSTNRRYGY